MSLKDYVIKHADPDLYYQSRFPQWTKQYHPNVLCPFHDDTAASLSLSLKNGGARCHASTCQKKSHGNIVHFESDLRGIPEKEAARRIYREFVRKVISTKIIRQFRDSLVTDGTLALKIRKELGLTTQTLRNFSVGYDNNSRRVTIPVYDPWGSCVNIRYYKLPSMRSSSDDAKIYNHKKGYGKCDLYPFPFLNAGRRDDSFYFMASEVEALLAIQDGYFAGCSTTGEGSFPDWFDELKSTRVYTVFDKDAGGKLATDGVGQRLAEKQIEWAPIILPFRTEGKDYRDWRVKEGRNPSNLAKYANRKSERFQKSNRIAPSSAVHPRSDSKLLGDESRPDLPKFASSDIVELATIGTSPRYLNLRVRTQGIVAAKASNTYSVPWKFSIEVKDRPKFEFELPFGRELLRFVKASDAAVLQSLQDLLGNNSLKVTPLAYITATEVEVIPIAVVDRDVPYVTQRCYYFGPDIKANVPYYLEVIPTSEIRSQETVGIITLCEAVSKSIDRFELTTEIETDLRANFHPSQEEDVWEKLTNLADELSKHYTRVYNRLDWHLVALLTWCSPLQLRFPDSPNTERGWINALALGDTETGKSKVAKALQRITNSGVFVNAENCTFAGLVGGAIKMGSGQLMLRWGRIPLSDKQLVVLEELSGLSVEEISNMSDVRSSGIARLDKGGINSQTNSRTRLLCLSNVRAQRKNLSGYLYGILAVQELVGHGEDIARFDLITTLVDNEVDIETINSNNFATVANESNLGLELAFKNLVHYIWSLSPDDIKFSERAWEECLEQTKRLSAIYHPAIPVFKGGSGRYKLGRIAAAIACLQFSRRDEKVQVLRAHVKAAAKLLQFIYDKPSFGYRQWSIQNFDRETIKNTRSLEETFTNLVSKHTSDVIDSIVHITRFNRDELAALGGLTIYNADQVLGAMLRSSVIKKGDANMWEITPPGKLWLERFRSKLKPTTNKSNGTRH